MTQVFSIGRWRMILCVAFISHLAFPLYATAGVPSLEWDANPEPYIAGYNVYTGEKSHSYTRVIDVGLQTSLPLTNLNAGITYYFAVTAYDTNRLESPFSDEIVYTSPVDGERATALPCSLLFSRASQTVRFRGRAGQQCRVAASSNLREWEEVYWVNLTDGEFVDFTEAVADANLMRFFRVVATPP